MGAHPEPETTLTGRSISPGLAMGPAWVVSDPLHWGGPTTPIGKDDVEKELVICFSPNGRVVLTVTKLPFTAEVVADEAERLFRDRVAWWGG
jgi:hypothetical protein